MPSQSRSVALTAPQIRSLVSHRRHVESVDKAGSAVRAKETALWRKLADSGVPKLQIARAVGLTPKSVGDRLK